MKKNYPALKNLAPIIFLLFVINAFSQTNGDFRSKAIGPSNWTSPASWQIYNASTSKWDNAITYPGQNTGTYSVTIQLGHTINIVTNLVTASMGSVIVNGTLNLVAGSDPKIITLSTLFLKISGTGTVPSTGGFLNFETQKIWLHLPENSVIQIDNGGLITGASSNN